MIIQDEVVQKAGTQGVMVETVSLFDIGDTIIAGSDKITLPPWQSALFIWSRVLGRVLGSFGQG